MKILAIRIRNLASLEGNVTIDFANDPLSSAGIFAITGPTGSGKSTILDAICLALYAKAPRFRQAESSISLLDVSGSPLSQGDERGILRDGMAEGFAEVDFVGMDHQHYRSRWSVRRARNRTDGNLQDYELTVTNLGTQRNLVGRKNELLQEIARLVGLTFDQFTRSVLLAQGDFTAFLKAGKDDKASLLEKLTGTQVYSEISRGIFERHRDENQQLRELNLRREGILTLTNEELAEMNGQRTELDERIHGQEEIVNGLTGEIAWYTQRDLLQAAVDAATEAQGRAVVDQQTAQPRVQQLQNVGRVQGIRSAVENRVATAQQLTDNSALLQQQEEALEHIGREQEEREQALKQATDSLIDRTREQEEAGPDLNRAKTLDVQLAEKGKQLELASQSLQEAQEKLGQMNRTLAGQKEEAKHTAAEIGRLTAWKRQHANRQTLADNESLILSKLQETATWREQESGIATLLEQGAGEKERITEEITRSEEQQESAAGRLQATREDYEQRQAELAAVPVETIEQEKTRVDTLILNIGEALTNWQLLWAGTQQLTTLTRKVESRHEELVTCRRDLANADQALGLASAQRETSRRALEKVQLAANESVEQLRAHLVAGEPCPVCGSPEHPYSTGNIHLDKALTDMNNLYQEHEQTHAKWLKEQSRLHEVEKHLATEIAYLEKEIADRITQLETFDAAWKTCALYQEAVRHPETERTAWLEQRQRQERGNQLTLSDQLQATLRMQRQVETLRDERDRLDREVKGIIEKLKDHRRRLESLDQKQQHQQTEQQAAKRHLADIEKQFEAYHFPSPWWDLWKTDLESLEGQVRAAIGEWKTSVQTLDNHLLTQTTLAASITGYEEQSAGMAGDVAKLAGHVDTLTGEQGTVDNQRKSLFDGRTVAAVEQALKTAVESARQRADEFRNAKEEGTRLLTRKLTEKEQTQKSIAELQQTRERLDGQIREWLATHNREHDVELTTEDLAELLGYTTDWIEEERASLRAIDDAVTRAHTILSERNAALTTHLEQRQPERSPGELDALLTEARSLLQESARTLNEIEFKLRQDLENKQRIGDLLVEIEAQAKRTENWAKLNEIIGSADGKKFRQIAQEYTLDVLLRFSNIQLTSLSTRYVLQRIPDSLGLQVIDRDMGDEVRAVFSLSGGESFLVSLSLALGLASLTSSRMQVESLFIDEGFGSLDLNTLHIAMDALERLHQQGRKVGVISHVQEMTERIPVQIRVSKQQSGRSIVEVVGA